MPNIAELANQLKTVRKYSENFLDNTDVEDWFRMPSEGVTHIAWQVGHMAIAEYGLALKRVRGRIAEDAGLVSDEFLALFGKGSIPDADAGKYPPAAEIRGVFDRVHQQAIQELQSLSEEVLDEASDPPHPMFNTKRGAIEWAAQHELLHAGQIGLLRRLLGKEWLR